uniref:Uncharacterized protein n=1 Tax=Romanomermis culicivorax TaxID=13658 RepID=A0A915JHD4_ROMCU
MGNYLPGKHKSKNQHTGDQCDKMDCKNNTILTSSCGDFTKKQLMLIYDTSSYGIPLYVDEDGDVANEFYQEIYCGSLNFRTLVKTNRHRLKRLGKIKYDIPRLPKTFPVLMIEASLFT